MNYNPISDKTLLGKIASKKERDFFSHIKCKLTKANRIYKVDVRIGNENNGYIIRLITEYENLAIFWKSNFDETDTNNPDGVIYFLKNSWVEKYSNSPSITDYRYLVIETDEIFVFGNDFYGNLKIAYRALCAQIALRDNLISLHSSALEVNNKTIAITGVSGSGKSTVFHLILKKLNGKFIWDDWGFISAKNLKLFVPNEIRNHLKIKSLSDSVNINKKITHTEFFKKGNKYFNSARAMINLRQFHGSSQVENNKKLDTLIILTNNLQKGHFIQRIDPDEGYNLLVSPNYSKAYDGNVSFFNGALILNQTLKTETSKGFRAILNQVNNIIQLNNNYTNIAHEELLNHL